MSNPWLKFYPRDWRGDQALRMVSLSARGLWIECMAIMHEAKPYGHLLVNGVRVGDDALARLVGASADEVRALLDELVSAGVASQTREGVIFSRRMTRDDARAKKGRKAVKKRWSQAADNAAQSGGPNRSPNRPPTTQKPEARSQKEKEPSVPKRGCRLPDDWSPAPSDLEWARGKERVPDSVLHRETEKFRDYWRGQPGARGVKLDWSATWKNWIRNAAERLPDDQRLKANGSANGAGAPSGPIDELSDDGQRKLIRVWLDKGRWLGVRQRRPDDPQTRLKPHILREFGLKPPGDQEQGALV